MDYKGQFRLGNGEYCYPLTVTDNHSRYLLGCKGLAGTLLEPTKEVLSRISRSTGYLAGYAATTACRSQQRRWAG